MSDTPNLDALVGELIAERDRHAELSAHRLKLLDQAHRQRDRMYHNGEILTKVEAEAWLSRGELPDNFRDRLENFVEFYQCPNCDGQEDMNIVMRCWDDEPSWCPFCVSEDDARRKKS